MSLKADSQAVFLFVPVVASQRTWALQPPGSTSQANQQECADQCHVPCSTFMLMVMQAPAVPQTTFQPAVPAAPGTVPGAFTPAMPASGGSHQVIASCTVRALFALILLTPDMSVMLGGIVVTSRATRAYRW